MTRKTKPAKDGGRTESEVVARIPVAEEIATVEKRVRETGKVRIDTRIVTDTEVLRETVQDRHVEVERVEVNRVVEAVPEIRREGETTIIPVVDEVLVVERQLVLREEVHVREVTRTEEVEVPVERRRTEVDITRE